MIIIDSALTLTEALVGVSLDCPSYILAAQRVITVRYRSYDFLEHQGQIVTHEQYAARVIVFFQKAWAEGFLIAKLKPIVLYGWSDERSMADNNSSGFHYRPITNGTGISLHAFGAFDINPVQNPYISPKETLPTGAEYNIHAPGTLTTDHPLIQMVREEWRDRWGGDWESFKDYQHIEPALVAAAPLPKADDSKSRPFLSFSVMLHLA